MGIRVREDQKQNRFLDDLGLLVTTILPEIRFCGGQFFSKFFVFFLFEDLFTNKW